MSKKSKPSNLGGFIKLDKQNLGEIDYLDKLSPEDRSWYEKFLENEYNARFHNDGLDVITDPEEKRRVSREKKFRYETDFWSLLFLFDNEDKCKPESYGTQLLAPRPQKTKLKRKPKSPKQKTLPPAKSIETLEEFLSRGGSIEKISEKKSE